MSVYTKSTGPALDVYAYGFRPGDGYVRCGPETSCEWECSEVSEDCTIPTTGCDGLFKCRVEVDPPECIPEIEGCKDPCACSGSAAGEAGLTAEDVNTLVTAAITEQVPSIAAQCATDAIVAAAAEKA